MVQDNIPHPEIKPDCPKETIFQVINPFGEEVYVAGSHVAIYWTGGPVGVQRVNIQLIDLQLWIVWHNITLDYENNQPLGAFHWEIPADLKVDPTHDYQVYIENVERTNWHYGANFKILRPWINAAPLT